MREVNLVEIGMIHGRFQPFHNGHLAYFVEACSYVTELMIIGITNPDGREVAHTSDDHRHRPADNPYSFTERALMISRSLDALRLNIETLIIPLWLDDESRWRVIPAGAVQFVNVMDDWDREKLHRFESFGFAAVPLAGRRIVSGQEVRGVLRSGESISELVPGGTSSVIAGEEWRRD